MYSSSVPPEMSFPTLMEDPLSDRAHQLAWFLRRTSRISAQLDGLLLSSVQLRGVQ